MAALLWLRRRDTTAVYAAKGTTTCCVRLQYSLLVSVTLHCPRKKSAPAMRPFVKIFCSLVTSTFVLRASCYVFCNARISNSTDFTKAIPATMVITIKKDVTLLARHAVLPWSYNQTGCGMTSSPGLRRWSRLQARRGVRDKRQRALLIWSSYVHD